MIYNNMKNNGNFRNQYGKKLAVLLICGLLALGNHGGGIVQAAKNDSAIKTQDDGTQMVFQPTGDIRQDSRNLKQLLGNDNKKTVVIPSGSEVQVDVVLRIGDNTTLIADGATIIQTCNEKGILMHDVDGGNYDSIKNVEVRGGVWKNAVNQYGCSMFRFAHGDQLTFQNVTIETNYEGHGLELIACRNVLVKNCKIVAKNDKTKNENSVEEALQIDIATPTTAPGISSNRAYVNGQVCKNIEIVNSEISGSRGVCANFASGDDEFKNNFHTNITIRGCTITGASAEGLALFNTAGCVVKKNTIITNSSRTAGTYGNGFSMMLFGTSKISEKQKNTILNNTIYGKNAGIHIFSDTGCKFGQTTIKGNKVYSKSGADKCMNINDCVKVSESNNKCQKWKK